MKHILEGAHEQNVCFLSFVFRTFTLFFLYHAFYEQAVLKCDVCQSIAADLELKLILEGRSI